MSSMMDAKREVIRATAFSVSYPDFTIRGTFFYRLVRLLENTWISRYALATVPVFNNFPPFLQKSDL